MARLGFFPLFFLLPDAKMELTRGSVMPLADTAPQSS